MSITPLAENLLACAKNIARKKKQKTNGGLFEVKLFFLCATKIYLIQYNNWIFNTILYIFNIKKNKQIYNCVYIMYDNGTKTFSTLSYWFFFLKLRERGRFDT